MKKILLLAIGFLMTMTASAQFEQGKYYCNGSLTGINLSYSGAEKLSLGVEAKGGYLVADNWMALVMAGYSHDEDVDDKFAVGVGGRYYIIQNGLYMGLNAPSRAWRKRIQRHHAGTGARIRILPRKERNDRTVSILRPVDKEPLRLFESGTAHRSGSVSVGKQDLFLTLFK